MCNDTTGGGAIGSYNYVSTYQIWIENCTFKCNRNDATGGHGGAITALNGGYLNVYDSTFVNNYADVGQAICAYNQVNDENETGGNPRLAIDRCTFINHTGSSDTVYAPGYVSSFDDNTFINSTQSTHFSGSGNSYNSINLPVLLMVKNNDLLSSGVEDILSRRTVASTIYVNISASDVGTGRNANDGSSWNKAYGSNNCLKDAFEYIDIGGTIIVADGTYTVAPNQDFILSNMYNNPFTIEGFGNQVIFLFDSVYNLDTGSAEHYGKTVDSTITHKNIIFDCDVTVGSKNFKFVNCTFNKGLEISRDYISDDVCNITFENCKFATPLTKENIAENNTVTVEGVQIFPIVAVNTTLDVSSAEKGIVVITLKDIEGNAVSDVNVTYYVNGVENTTKTDGNGTITLSELKGIISVAANYTGSEAYNPSNTTTNFTFPYDSTLTAAKVTATYNVAKNLIITLKDDEGNVLADKKVNVKVGTINKAFTTDKKGQIKVNVAKLVPKTSYTATIKFTGDDLYTKSSTTAKVTVKKATPKITAKTKSFKAKVKTKKVTATLKDNKGNIIKSTKVTLKIKGKTYKATTNKKGVATFKVTKLNKKGTYKGTIKFAGNKYFKAISKKVTIKVKK